MSASTWTRCPRCHARAHAQIRQQEAAVKATYGTVPADEYMAAIVALPKPPVKLPDTFREYYEIWGAAGGTVHVDYSGHCTECGLELSFNHEHKIPDLEVEGSVDL